MANDKRQYPYYGRSSSNVYSGFPATNSQESFIPQSRHQIPQLEIAPSTMPFDRALDVWNGMSEPNSPNLGLDNILPPASGVDERSTNVRVSTLSHPSSHTLQMPSNSPNEISPDPLSRFYNETGPWTPKGIADINNQPVALPRHPRPLGLPMRYNEPNFPFSQYQTTAGSELESSTTGPYPSDSGYGTRSQATTSVLSSDPVDRIQECSSISGHIDNLQLYSGSTSQGYSYPDSQACAQPIEYQPDTEHCQSANLQCHYVECGVIVKCQSELKKHIRRHEKPYKCEESGCNRKEGFSTTNDLDRHRKSVHNIAPKHGHDRSFRCPVSNCSKKDKIWPRLDNFRQHLKRMHSTDDTDELLAKAERKAQAFHNGSRSQGDGLGHESSLDYVTAESAMTHRENDSFHHSISPLRDFGGGEGLESSVPGPRAHPRLSRLLTPTSAPLARSVSRGSTSSDRSNQRSSLDHTRTNVNTVQRFGDTIPQLSPFADLSRGQATEPLRSSSASSSGHSNLPQLSLAVEHYTPSPDTTASPRLNTTVEDVSQAISCRVANCIKAGTLDEYQMQMIVQTSLLSLIGPQASSPKSVNRRSSNHSAAHRRKISCDECSKTLTRHCDMKKHKKRHSKPYGCTFHNCTKIFGSKNDWKRHENSQHFQLESWRCHEPDPNSKIQQCAKLFYCREELEQHLKQYHQKLNVDYIKGEVKRSEIGRNGQGQFWCGFCRKIIRLERGGLEAWDERFNHVDDKHFKIGQRISEWVPVDGHGPKGPQPEDTLQEHIPCCLQDEDDEESCEADSNQDPTMAGLPDDAISLPTPKSLPKRTASPISNQGPPGKKLQMDKKGRKDEEAYRYCCICNDGPHAASRGSCPMDGHRYCRACPTGL